MKTLTIKETVIGSGLPKVCVPITGRNRREILEEAKNVREMAPDLVEWRADCCEEGKDSEKCLEVLKALKELFDRIPLIFTFRSAGEGGECPIVFEDYVNLLLKTAESGLADLIDVEAFFRRESTEELIRSLKAQNAAVIASNHHFEGTPAAEVMVSLMEEMEAVSADIVKLAVMPQNEEDLCSLMAASFRMKQKDSVPFITMSMGQAGVLSRLCGEITGSAVTFASGVRASAPGQVPIERLRRTMELLHESFT